MKSELCNEPNLKPRKRHKEIARTTLLFENVKRWGYRAIIFGSWVFLITNLESCKVHPERSRIRAERRAYADSAYYAQKRNYFIESIYQNQDILEQQELQDIDIPDIGNPKR